MMNRLLVLVLFALQATLPIAAGGNHRLRGVLLKKTGASHDIFSSALRDKAWLLDRSSSGRRVQQAANGGDLRDEWTKGCASLLAREDVVEDGIISQNEFATMLLSQCGGRLDGPCPHKGKKLKFEQLDTNLQLDFIRGICPQEEVEDRIDCIYNLNEMWLETDAFGFETGDENVDVLVHDMCFETYSDAVEMGFAGSSGESRYGSESV